MDYKETLQKIENVMDSNEPDIVKFINILFLVETYDGEEATV